jgi:hypothetical protein
VDGGFVKKYPHDDLREVCEMLVWKLGGLT